ncbi:hypothetical protein [Methanobrevibacter arboriphilus]|nr:hypothetical protein [Methanobrevibacter arboriphilus]
MQKVLSQKKICQVNTTPVTITSRAKTIKDIIKVTYFPRTLANG